MDLSVFIGYDPRHRAAWHVCAASMQSHAGDYPLPVQPIGRQRLEHLGFYTRPTEMHGDRVYDVRSAEYLSTEFSLARFWVPFLAGRSGWALFCDSDFLWRADLRKIMDLADPRYAVMVVPNEHAPTDTTKMAGQAQTAYNRKNWSSLMLWNLGHAGAHRPNLHDLNNWHKHEMHGLSWLASMEIGFLPHTWNSLEGVAPPDCPNGGRCRDCDCRGDCAEPIGVHFTNGTPDMPGYEDSQHADEWRTYLSTQHAAPSTQAEATC